MTAKEDYICDISQITDAIKQCLADFSPAFNFYEQASQLQKDENRVSKLSQSLVSTYNQCIVKTGLIKGLRKEKSQQNLYLRASQGFPELHSLVENDKLIMWIVMNTFQKLLDSVFMNKNSDQELAAPITPEEADIAHYVGGFVVSKLKQRLSKDESIISLFIVQDSPQGNTLLKVKSRGRLTNLSCQAKTMFVEMEQVFRDLFPFSSTAVSEELYLTSCYSNEVIQDCFLTSTYSIDTKNEEKDNLLSKMISLYFKVRVHHRCKTIIDNVRRKNKLSGKDRALRSKLST